MSLPPLLVNGFEVRSALQCKTFERAASSLLSQKVAAKLANLRIERCLEIAERLGIVLRHLRPAYSSHTSRSGNHLLKNRASVFATLRTKQHDGFSHRQIVAVCNLLFRLH